MSALSMTTWTERDIEENADIVKVAVVQALVNEGLIAEDRADEWAATHTIRLCKKSIWRTLSDRWRREGETSDSFYVVVKTV